MLWLTRFAQLHFGWLRYFIAYHETVKLMKIYFLYKLEQIDSPIHTLSTFLTFDALSWLKMKGPVLWVLSGAWLINLRLVLHILQSFEDSRHFWCSDSCCEKGIVDYIAIVYIYTYIYIHAHIWFYVHTYVIYVIGIIYLAYIEC